MKPFISIISFYFVFLTILPCYCTTYTLGSDKGKVGSVLQTHSEDNFELEKCTPFCACASYHNPIFVEKEALSDFQQKHLFATDPVSVYNENKTNSYLSRLLRPPQV